VADVKIAYSKMLVEPINDLMNTGFTFIPNAGPGEQAFYLVLISGALLAQFSNFETTYSWSQNTVLRGARSAVSLALIFFLYPTVKEQFIYFQF
jgi:hypothetical protein